MAPTESLACALDDYGACPVVVGQLFEDSLEVLEDADGHGVGVFGPVEGHDEVATLAAFDGAAFDEDGVGFGCCGGGGGGLVLRVVVGGLLLLVLVLVLVGGGRETTTTRGGCACACGGLCDDRAAAAPEGPSGKCWQHLCMM